MIECKQSVPADCCCLHKSHCLYKSLPFYWKIQSVCFTVTLLLKNSMTKVLSLLFLSHKVFLAFHKTFFGSFTGIKDKTLFWLWPVIVTLNSTKTFRRKFSQFYSQSGKTKKWSKFFEWIDDFQKHLTIKQLNINSRCWNWKISTTENVCTTYIWTARIKFK